MIELNKREMTTEDEMNIRSDMAELMDKLQSALADVEDIIEDRKFLSDYIQCEFDYESNKELVELIEQFSEVTEEVKNAIERI